MSVRGIHPVRLRWVISHFGQSFPSQTQNFYRCSGLTRSYAMGPKKKDSTPAPDYTSQSGGLGNQSDYCLSCGRLMPGAGPNAKPIKSSTTIPDATPRKYCSTSCRTRAKNPSLREYHLLLAKTFHDALRSSNVAICSEVEKTVAAAGVQGQGKGGAEDAREEARRTARRLVHFGFRSQGVEEDRSVEAVQAGKVVEASFAKGEWGIRWVT